MVNAMFTMRSMAAYEFYNILFFISLFWSLKDKEATEPVNVVSLERKLIMLII
jgi:hypothetical protein